MNTRIEFSGPCRKSTLTNEQIAAMSWADIERLLFGTTQSAARSAKDSK